MKKGIRIAYLPIMLNVLFAAFVLCSGVNFAKYNGILIFVYMAFCCLGMLFAIFENQKIEENMFTLFIGELFLIIAFCLEAVLKGSVKGIFIYIYILVSIFVFSYVHKKKLFYNATFIICLGLWIMWAARVRGYFDQFMIWSASGNSDNILNSNTVAQIFYLLTIIIVALLDRKKINKFIQIIIAVVGIWGIWQTASRMALFGILLWIILYFLVNKFLESKYVLLIYDLAYVLGFLFPVIYVNLYTTYKQIDFSFNVKSFFSGREKIWMEFWQLLIDKPYMVLYGIGEWNGKLKYLSATGANLHNWYLTITYSFGLIGVIMFYFTFRVLIKKASQNINDANKCAICGLISIFYCAIGENVLGYYPLIPLISLIISFALFSNEEKSLRKERVKIRW